MKVLLLKYWKWLVMVVMLVVIIILIFSKCSHISENTTTIVTETIPGDPYPVYETITKPVPYIVITPADTFWKDVDTAIILQKCKLMYKDYYTKNIYNDTLKDDTSALITLLDTVYRNKLQSRVLGFQNRRIKVINTTTTIIGEIPRNKFYLGAGINGEVNPFFRDPTITLNGLLVLKKRWAYEAEVGFPIQNIKNIRVGLKAYYKISFRKK